MRLPSTWPRLYSRALRAEHDFAMLEPGDRILAAVSGGTDSLALLALLAHQRTKIGKKLGIELFPAHVPGSYRGRSVADVGRLERICRELGLRLHLGGTTLSEGVFNDCFRCSQARRRLLFDLAESLGCSKIALGHNADDMVETLLLNIFYSGRLAALSPRQAVLRGKLALIRPLAYVWKDDISGYARQRFGRIPSFRCPGSRDSRRMSVRRLLARLSKTNPHLKANLLNSISNLRPEYLPVPQRKTDRMEVS
jgi:tRNA 2-thiocytidine biosynthesis protein TtcA